MKIYSSHALRMASNWLKGRNIPFCFSVNPSVRRLVEFVGKLLHPFLAVNRCVEIYPNLYLAVIYRCILRQNLLCYGITYHECDLTKGIEKWQNSIEKQVYFGRAI